MNTQALAKGIAIAVLGWGGFAATAAAAPLLSIETNPGSGLEETGDPGGSFYPWTNGLAGHGPGIPWERKTDNGSHGGGWADPAPGLAPDLSFVTPFQTNYGTSGYNGAYLKLNEATQVTFQFMGKGNSNLANLFQVDWGLGFTTLFDANTAPCGAQDPSPVFPTCTAGVDPVSDPGKNQYTLALDPALSGGYVAFRYLTGTSPEVPISYAVTNDGSGNPGLDPQGGTVGPGYFLGFDPYLAAGTYETSGTAAYAGLADLPRLGSELDHDYQDMGVRISVEGGIPEPTTLALLGIGMLGLRQKRRRA